MRYAVLKSHTIAMPFSRIGNRAPDPKAGLPAKIKSDHAPSIFFGVNVTRSPSFEGVVERCRAMTTSIASSLACGKELGAS